MIDVNIYKWEEMPSYANYGDGVGVIGRAIERMNEIYRSSAHLGGIYKTKDGKTKTIYTQEQKVKLNKKISEISSMLIELEDLIKDKVALRSCYSHLQDSFSFDVDNNRIDNKDRREQLLKKSKGC